MGRKNFTQLEVLGVDASLPGNPPRKAALRATAVREETVKGRASPEFSTSMKEGRGQSYYAIRWTNPTTLEKFFPPGSGFDFYQAAKMDFLGWSKFSIVDSKIYRSVPYPHPSDPNYLYAESIQRASPWIPLGRDNAGVAKYDEAMVSLNYSTRNYVISDDGVRDESTLRSYVSIKTEPIGRVIGIPAGSSLRWIERNQATGQQNVPFSSVSSATQMEAEVSIVWHQVPVQGIPWEAISSCVQGSDLASSDGVYRFLSQSYLGPVLQGPEGRLISNFVCLVPKISDPYLMPNNDWAVDITYRFLYKPFGANSWYRWETGRYEEARVFRPVGPGVNVLDKFYPEKDFATLFWGVTS